MKFKFSTPPYLRISEATAKGYIDVYPGECWDWAFPDSKTRRGRYCGVKCNALMAGGQEIYLFTTMTDKEKLAQLRAKMPEDKQGVEIDIDGKKYAAFIRRLTPVETGRLQGVPDWYKWDGVSESQQYKMHGNGWQIDTITYIWQFMPKFDRPIKVWSLFDGMSCASVALKNLGIEVETFISSEIDKYAIIAEKTNFPNMIQVGSVTDINVKELVEKYGVPDLLCGGSPCQSFSFSGKMKGMATKEGHEIYSLDEYLKLKAENFEFEGQSYLFWEYMRILTELRKYNPDILFFLENVEMLDKWERCLSHAIGVQGVHINSALVCAQQRKRIYWTNFRTRKEDELFFSFDDEDDDPFEMPSVISDIPQPKDRGLVISDVLEDECSDKYYLKDAMVEKLLANTDKAKLAEYVKD